MKPYIQLFATTSSGNPRISKKLYVSALAYLLTESLQALKENKDDWEEDFFEAKKCQRDHLRLLKTFLPQNFDKFDSVSAYHFIGTPGNHTLSQQRK